MRNNRLTELEGILANFIENKRIDNLAANFVVIISALDPIHSLPKFIDVLRRASGNKFYRIFCEFSKENRAQIVEITLTRKDVTFAANILYQLLLLAERWPREDKYRRVAGEMVTLTEIVRHLLISFDIDDSKQEALGEVYSLRFKDERDTTALRIALKADYMSYGYEPTPRQQRAKKIFEQILREI